MYSTTISLLRHFLPAIAIFDATIGWSSPSDAYVQKIVIDQQISLNIAPITLGTSTPAPATPYTIYTGRIFGELDPSDPQHSIITDIEHAPKTQGKVTYVANFQIVTPTDPRQRSGLLIHEVPNRGNNAIPMTALVQGATYAQSGWQGDLLAQCSPSPAIPYPCFDLNSGAFGTLNSTTGALVPPNVPDVAVPSGLKALASYVVQVPVATHGNSSNNGNGQGNHNGDDHGAGNIIEGQVYGHVCSGTNGCGLPVPTGAPPSTAQLAIQGPAFVPYHPASLDTKQARFWSVSSQTAAGVTSAKTPIPSGQWRGHTAPMVGQARQIQTGFA